MTWDPFHRPKMVAQGRVVRNLSDDDDDPPDNPTEPQIPPFVAPDATGDLRVTRLPKREPKMPKGIYERKPRLAAEESPSAAVKEPKKRGRKARAVVVVPQAAAAKANGSTARFDVSLDLRAGAVTINAAAGSLTLAPDELLALFAFLGRRG